MKNIILLIFSILFFTNSWAESVFYNNEYQGIVPGRSTFVDVVSEFGITYVEKKLPKLIKYSYPEIQFTISDISGRVNTIVIFNKSYSDENGVKIGFSREKVNKLISYKISLKETIGDIDKGIIYHFNSDKVEKIVLAYAFVIKPPYEEVWKSYFKTKMLRPERK